MRHIRLFVIMNLLLLSAPLFAGQDEYDDCILKYLKNAKHDVATHFIRQACYENHMNPTFTPDRRRAYNECVLEHLIGVESFEAVMEISNACSRRHK